MREGSHLALKFFHPVAGHARAIALGIAKRSRSDVGDANVDLTTPLGQGTQDGVIGRVAVNKPLGCDRSADLSDSHDPVTGTRQEDDLARLRVIRASDVVDLDLPAEVAGANHEYVASSGSPALNRRHDQNLGR